MRDTFDPAAMLALASELAAGGPDGAEPTEVRLRTAVGRAYYAVFTTARRKTGVYLRDGVHSAVVYQVTRRWGSMVGKRLERLKMLREAADYEYRPRDPQFADWKTNWEDARVAAAQVLEKLNLRR